MLLTKYNEEINRRTQSKHVRINTFKKPMQLRAKKKYIIYKKN